MNVMKLLLATVVVGVVMNIFDFVVNGQLLAGYMAGMPIMKKELPIPMLVVADFVAALVLVCVFARVRSAFSAGPQGGATFGLYAGILVNFPTWIIAHLVFEGFPYGASWVLTVVGILWCVIAGAVAGAVYKQ